jgi:hypothetical protein
MTDPKFWSDDFDMDLPKILPEARSLLGAYADLELVTHGHETHGRLNHPTVWNHGLGMVAFFGRHTPMKPASFWTDSPLVRCTLWEAIRDAWVHDIVILFEGQTPIWDGSKTREQFNRLMYHLRGWRRIEEAEVDAHKAAVQIRIELVHNFLAKAGVLATS